MPLLEVQLKICPRYLFSHTDLPILAMWQSNLAYQLGLAMGKDCFAPRTNEDAFQESIRQEPRARCFEESRSPQEPRRIRPRSPLLSASTRPAAAATSGHAPALGSSRPPSASALVSLSRPSPSAAAPCASPCPPSAPGARRQGERPGGRWPELDPDVHLHDLGSSRSTPLSPPHLSGPFFSSHCRARVRVEF